MARVAAGLAVLALPVGAAACGGSGKSGTTAATPSAVSAAQAVHRAAAKTAAAGSEHVSLSAKVIAGGQSLSLSGSGDFDTPKRLGALHATFDLAGTQSTLDEVLSGSTIYVSSPLFATLVPGAKKWLKLDLASAGSTFGADASALLSQDPAAALAQLKTLGDVKDLGSEQVGGASATHYRGRIDPSKLSGPAAQALQASGAKVGPFDVWVGQDGYVRKLKISTSAGSSTATVNTAVTMTLSGFGEQVQVSVPPASETLDATNLSIPGLGG